VAIADTSAWIAFLRDPDSDAGREMTGLLRADEVRVVGIVLAEVLQGARTLEQMEAIGRRLQVLPYIETTKEAWLKAAEMAVQLRSEGKTTALSDLLIAAQAMEADEAIYTLDEDFRRIPGVRLHEARS
jgi:tRNA(fMet)-specific endonuclease VapC